MQTELQKAQEEIKQMQLWGVKDKWIKDGKIVGRVRDNDPEYNIERFDNKTGYMYLIGEKYPMRCCPYSVKMEQVWLAKKGIFMVVKTFNELNWFQKLIYLIGFTQWWKQIMNTLDYQLEEVYYKPECYTPAVKEIRRCLPAGRFKEIASIILQLDNAYLFPVQDVLGELNKSNKPLKEFKRLTDMLVARWTPGKGVARFAGAIKVMQIYLFFDRRSLKRVEQFFQDIDIDAVKLSVEDIYWSDLKPHYNFGNRTYEERLNHYNRVKTNMARD